MTRPEFLHGLEEILGIAKGTLRQADDRTTVAEWTSLADVKIFAFIESELGLDPDDQLIEASSVADLLGILEDRGAFSQVSGVETR